MKQLLLLLTGALLAAPLAQAKKVKFSVDMSGQTVSANGVHITGDFQTAAGYSGGNWAADKVVMAKEGSTTIYSVVVNIPAFQKYEYKFVNGDQTYDLEFVPEESRVGYNFNDNRWIYVDSLSNDTLSIGAIRYAGNAPAGKYLLRFKVDMRAHYPVAIAGAHVAGSFQGTANPATTRLYSFQDSVYEYIAYVAAGTFTYRYYDGNTAATAETVPSACASNGERSVAVSADKVLPVVCFSSCSACVPTAVRNSIVAGGDTKIYPNPASEYATISFSGDGQRAVCLLDATGRLVRRYEGVSGNQLRIEREGLQSGLYLIRVTDAAGKVSTGKLNLR